MDVIHTIRTISIEVMSVDCSTGMLRLVAVKSGSELDLHAELD